MHSGCPLDGGKEDMVYYAMSRRERVSRRRTGKNRTGEQTMGIIEEWEKTERAFKVPKKVRAAWDAMTERGDVQGRYREEMLFIAKAMKKVGSRFADMAEKLYLWEVGICEKRDKEDGLKYMDCELGRGYYNMALALVSTVTNPEIAKRFRDGE